MMVNDCGCLPPEAVRQMYDAAFLQVKEGESTVCDMSFFKTACANCVNRAPFVKEVKFDAPIDALREAHARSLRPTLSRFALMKTLLPERSAHFASVSNIVAREFFGLSGNNNNNTPASAVVQRLMVDLSDVYTHYQSLVANERVYGLCLRVQGTDGFFEVTHSPFAIVCDYGTALQMYFAPQII